MNKRIRHKKAKQQLLQIAQTTGVQLMSPHETKRRHLIRGKEYLDLRDYSLAEMLTSSSYIESLGTQYQQL